MSSVVISGDTSGTITLQAPAAAGSSVITLGANSGTNILDTNTPAFRNRIINGAMMIDQRNAGASVTGNDGVFPVDRFKFRATQTSKLTGQQSTTSTAGFKNSLAVTSSSAYSVVSGDFFAIQHGLEGLNMADFGWGTANAVTVTLSFWVRSSLTGTFGGSVYNGGGTRSYPFTYTINAANTFEYKTVTIAGDTSGTWATDNSVGLYLNFGLGCGSTFSGAAGSWASAVYLSATGATSVVGTSGATFYITGVQLEKGSTATSFDYRPYGTELALCQRYLPAWTGTAAPIIVGQATSTTNALVTLPFVVTPRVAPTGVTITSVGALSVLNNTAGAGLAATAATFNSASFGGMELFITVASGLAAGNATRFAGTGIFGTGCEL